MKLGVDVVKISRMQNIQNITLFLSKICTEQEIDYIQKQCNAKQEFTQKTFATIAGLYAAKEAVLKALGCGVSQGAKLKDVEILHTKHGKPYVKLCGKTLQIFCEQGFGQMEISISHDAGLAVAVCCTSV